MENFKLIMKKVFIILGLTVLLVCDNAYAGSYKYSKITFKESSLPLMTVVGFFRNHVVLEKETLLDIARDYDLGFNEIDLLYPDMDPWIPEKGKRLLIPVRWVLPSTKHEEVVVNIPEMRLYRFFKKYKMVKTYPVGIGMQGFETPITEGRVNDLEVNPVWTSPPSFWNDYGKKVVQPGPDNPLGKYWIGLSAKHLGIHGTYFPWGIGRQVSRGCIRLYPEDISQLFKEVGNGTHVEIIYEPVKVGVEDHKIYLEVHPDVYNRIFDMFRYTEDILVNRGVREQVDINKVFKCVREKNGVPFPVGTIAEGGDGLAILN